MQVTTSKEAELNAAEKMRSWGYLDAESPDHGADGGIDVRSSRALAQVKWRSKKAGRPELQNLVGAREGDTSKVLMFFDFKGYSSEAIDYANRSGIALYVYDASGAVSSVNAAGRRLMSVPLTTKLLTITRTTGVQVSAVILLGLVLAGVLMLLVGQGFGGMEPSG